MTRLGVGQPGIRTRIPTAAEVYCFEKCPHRFWNQSILLASECTGVNERDMKTVWSFTYTIPCVFTAWHLIKHRFNRNFIVYLTASLGYNLLKLTGCKTLELTICPHFIYLFCIYLRKNNEFCLI